MARTRFAPQLWTLEDRATPALVSIAPTANDDFAQMVVATAVGIDVLANDTAPGGEIALGSIRIVTPPTHGTVTREAYIEGPPTGTSAIIVVYRPKEDFDGTDTFQYTIRDNAGVESAPATVTVVVFPNHPTANPDTANTFGSAPVVIDVLANDTDPNANGEIDPTSVKAVSGPTYGSVSIDAATGRITYTPYPPFVGTDVFDYIVRDSRGAESTGRVRVRVDFPAGQQITAVGSGTGGGPRVDLLNADGTVRNSFFAYESTFTGGVSVAVADVNGDGVADIITGAGAGGAPLVKVFSGSDLKLLASFFAFEESFRGGVNVAAGNVTGDGFADVIAGAGVGGAPRVVVFTSRIDAGYVLPHGVDPASVRGTWLGLEPRRSFFAFESAFTNGVRVAAGDIDGDGFAEVIVGAGSGGGPVVRAFDGDGGLLKSFFAADPSFRGGVSVAAGDVDGDGVAEIITGVGPGGASRVQIFNGATGEGVASFFAYITTYTGGVRVGAADLNHDGRVDVLAAPESGTAQPVVAFDGVTLAPLGSFDSFAGVLGGVFVGGHG